jgi:5,10-methylenetetrahydromethanopterin reductase
MTSHEQKPNVSTERSGSAARPDPQWGVGLGKVLATSRVPQVAVEAEALGYHEAWVSNERFHRDMFVSLGAAAVLTDKLRLGTFVADPFMVRPTVTAAAIASVDELSGGRAMFGLGAGGSGFAQVGLRPRQPVKSMENALAAFRGLLAGETVSCEDPNFELHDARLEVKPHTQVPITLASQSPKMLALGGGLADSVMISTFADPTLFSMAMTWAAEGAAERGRVLDVSRDVIARIDVAIDDDLDRARDALRPLVGQLLVLLHPNWFFVDTLGVVIPEELQEIAARRDYAAMSKHLDLIPTGLIDGFSWVGTPERIAEQVLRLTALGVRRVVVLPHALSGDPVPTLAEFMRSVVPIVERSL